MRIMHYGRILANNKWNVKNILASSKVCTGLREPLGFPRGIGPTWDLVRVPGELGVRGGTAKAISYAVHMDHSQSSPYQYAHPLGELGSRTKFVMIGPPGVPVRRDLQDSQASPRKENRPRA